MSQRRCKWTPAVESVRLTFGRFMQSPPELDALLTAAVDTLAANPDHYGVSDVRKAFPAYKRHPMVARAQLEIDRTLQAMADAQAASGPPPG